MLINFCDMVQFARSGLDKQLEDIVDLVGLGQPDAISRIHATSVQTCARLQSSDYSLLQLRSLLVPGVC